MNHSSFALSRFFSEHWTHSVAHWASLLVLQLLPVKIEYYSYIPTCSHLSLFLLVRGTWSTRRLVPVSKDPGASILNQSPNFESTVSKCWIGFLLVSISPSILESLHLSAVLSQQCFTVIPSVHTPTVIQSSLRNANQIMSFSCLSSTDGFPIALKYISFFFLVDYPPPLCWGHTYRQMPRLFVYFLSPNMWHGRAVTICWPIVRSHLHPLSLYVWVLYRWFSSKGH